MPRRRPLTATLAYTAAMLGLACGPDGSAPPPPTGPLVIATDDASTDAGDDANADASPDDATVAQNNSVGDAYAAVPEWSGQCVKSPGAIDVNLGNTPENFVTAAYCQVTGAMPSADIVSTWANNLRTLKYVRRIDVVRTFCSNAGSFPCSLTYSNPWQKTVLETDTCTRKTARDVGAVMLFFFGCPLGTNCTMDWANTHAWGMNGGDVTYGFGGAQPTGYYAPDNPGFWLRELLDARHAGLQFVAPNEYGNDTQYLGNLEQALTSIDGMGGGMQVALFDDTSNWGKVAGMSPAPTFADPQAAAQKIYAVQWQPFFTTITKAHWYTVSGTGGAPLIYFYNGGTLGPASGTSAVIAAMKQLFQADFGVAPFVDVDKGYGTVASADAQFGWDTFQDDPDSNYGWATTTGGLTFANSMVKWDSLGRDHAGRIATSSDGIFKDTTILKSVLQNTATANLLLLETWNDLGEGTGITRNYDYYFQGQWQQPDAFMSVIRAAQCSN